MLVLDGLSLVTNNLEQAFQAGLIHPPEKNSFNPFVSLNLDQLSMEVQRSN
jgi:hypothetical protein